jgi:hypothetical protein
MGGNAFQIVALEIGRKTLVSDGALIMRTK